MTPNNPNLSYIAPQGWVPTDQNIADLNAEIAKAETQRATAFLRCLNRSAGLPWSVREPIIRIERILKKARGREPLAEAIANKLMVPMGAGYVPRDEAAKLVGKRARWFAKDSLSR